MCIAQSARRSTRLLPAPAAMALMRWSSAAMAKRYQPLIDTIRRDVARQVGGLLWDADDASPEHVARANETRPDTEPGRWTSA